MNAGNHVIEPKVIGFYFFAQDYLPKIKAINVLKCPKDFRLVWIDYVQAWQRRFEAGSIGKIAAKSEIIGGAAAEVHTGGKAGVEAVEDGNKKLEGMDTASAWMAVEKAAIAIDSPAYNVSFQKKPIDFENCTFAGAGKYSIRF